MHFIASESTKNFIYLFIGIGLEAAAAAAVSAVVAASNETLFLVGPSQL